jgi:hypothetical protein
MNLPTTWRKLVAARMARAASRSARLRVEVLEPRENPAGLVAVGSEVGEDALLTAFDATTFEQRFSVNPYPGFAGGVHVAVGDVDGDGTADVVTGPGVGGGPNVNVYSGADGRLLRSFTVGDPDSRNGASVGTADYDRDGRADLVVGTTAGGAPLVQVLRFADGAVLRSYTPFEGAGGAVSVAAADLTGDGVPDTVVGAGAGFAPRVTVFDGATNQAVMNAFAFESTFTGGVRVSAGTVGGAPVVLVAAGPTGGPRVQGQVVTSGQTPINFFAYDPNTRAGVRAGLMDVDRDGDLDIVTAGGPGQPRDLRAFDARNLAGLAVPSLPGLPVVAAFDTVAPTATLTADPADPTRTAPLAFTATFDEPVNGFTAADLSVTNGAVSNFVAVDARTYTFDVTPAGQGAVTVTVAAGAATDAAGNESPASAPVTRTFDTVAPTATVNPLTTNDTTPTVTGTVDEAGAAVTVTVGGQTVAATVTGTTFSATLPAALAEGTYTVTATATDAAGNVGTATATDALVIDTTAPTAAVTSPAPDPTNTSPIPFTVTFSEDVAGFDAADLTVTNGTASGFTAADPRTYTFAVTPAGQGAVSVAIPAGAATDAAGNASAAAGPATRAFDTIAPTAAADALTTNDPTPTVTGTVSSDPSVPVTVTVTVGGQTVAATVTGTTFTATLTTPLAEGTYDIAVTATDAAGNTGSATRAGGLVVDLTAPAAAVSTTAADPTNLAAIPFTVTFTEDVAGFAAADVTVANGTLSNFAAVDARTYTLDVAPAADGGVTVSVAAGVATDPAGNPNTAAADVTVTSDRTPPTATITTTAPDPTATSPIPVTVTFSEDVTGFDETDIAVTNGAVTNFAAVDARTYTLDVTPAAAGQVTVSVPAGAAADAAGNENAAPTPLSVTFNGTVTAPTIGTTATDPTNLAVIPFTVTFDDDVTGFDETDITVANGTLSNFAAVDARTYTFDVAPAADGAVTVDIAAGAATDTGGRPTAAGTFTVTSDRTAPAATVTAPADPTNADPILFTVAFDEDVTGLDAADLTATNGTVGAVTAVDARTFAVEVSPTADGLVTLTVLAGSVTDPAGNVTAADATGSTTSDRTAPTPTVTTSEPDPTAAAVIPFTVTFDEDVTGFDETDVTVTNGAVTNFVMVDARTFTFDVTPAGDGLVTVDLPAGAAQDPAGNGSAAASASVTSERLAPTAAVTTTAGTATNVSPIPFTVTFSEDVTGFTDAGLVVANGTVSNFVAVDARTFTFDVTPAAEGAVTVSVAAGAALDMFGNANPASPAAAVEYDITAPTPAVSTTATDPTNLDAIPFTVTFDEDVTGFDETDIAVANGAASNFVAVDARTFTFDVTPAADGPVAVSVAAAAAQDLAGNTSAASNTVTVTSDRTAPTATVTAPADPTNADPIVFTVTFDEPAADLSPAGLTATNGTVGTVTRVDARTFTVEVSPAADGPVTLTVPAGAAADVAGNVTTADASASTTSDRTAPTPTVSTTASDPTNLAAIPFAVTFDEDVVGFDDTDVTVTNGTVGNFVAVDARTFTFDVTPAADGPVAVSVAAAAAQDLAGNTSAASNTVTVTSDRTAPTVAGVTVDPMATPDGAYAAGTVIDILVTFAEPVTVDTTGGTPTLALNSGGTATYLAGIGTNTLTFRYVVGAGDDAADLDYASTAALALNGGAIADAAGNPADLTLAAPGAAGSLGAARDIRIDTTGPTGTIDAASVGAVTGTAADANAGVTAVAVSIFDPVSMLYWDGTAFTSPAEVFVPATDTSGSGDFATWAVSVPAGTYEVRARITDAAGNETTLGPTTVTVS